LTRLILAALAIANFAATPQQQFEGSLSRYNPDVMPRVLEWRHDNGIPAGFDPYRGYDGYIAVAWCELVGKEADVQVYVRGEYIGTKHVLIADCAGHWSTYRWMYEQQIAAELDWQSWCSWGLEDGTGAWVKVEVITEPDD
jgi:hypothetical protein